MRSRQVKQKVVCYIVRDGRLLVFRHLGEPWDESGLQVPGGSIQPGESPEAAALREAGEETGLRRLRVVRKVGQTEYDMAPYRVERHHRHVFHLEVEGDVPERWIGHEDDPDDGSAPKRFECYWIPLARGHTLSAGQGALLGDLDGQSGPTLRISAQSRDEPMAHQSTSQVIHQHPLAYLLGLEGIALMRAFAGEYDRAFTEARITEVRELLDRTAVLGPGVDVPPLPVVDGYDGWATTYDGEDNGCFPMRDDVLTPMLDRLTPGRALDAACGTGAVAQQLVARGHDVVGIDISAAMLSRARNAVPEARFIAGDLTDLPLPDGDVDHVVCSLALAHVGDLGAFFAEAARVMRPGGHLLLLDTRGHFTGSTRYPLVKEAPDGRVGYIAGYSHGLGDYLRAALPYGYVVRACEETYRDDRTVQPGEMAEPLTPGAPDIWELHPWVPEAANAAKAGQPAVVAWDLELRPDV